ncbi:MAG: Coenzyme F420 hydrogenase/dehydrogenase, beta subunit C-terminal domain [Lachnospiraceae bacterium]|nr:Coenzyme F420 hydrogenase/dehydrogenase, beta subunit C-terminal domain [Lachnospiraceae bacterium]
MITISDKSKCCGCSACASACPTHCIAMEKDEEGFKYPKVNAEKCIKCGICERVCPFIKCEETKGSESAFAAYALNDDIRVKSSSGGVLTVLAEEVLRKNGLVYGVSMSNDCRSCGFICVDSVNDISNIRGSKYIQADVDCIYREVEQKLKENRCVLFSGTPCQCNGLKKYLRVEYDNLLTVDFVCHGVPSQMLWDKYVSHIAEVKKIRINAVDFRYKKVSWNKFGFGLKSNKACVYIPKDSSSYFCFFMKNLSLRPSCYNCKAKKTRFADITIGDFWGIERIFSKVDTEKGVSLIIPRTKKGYEFIGLISDHLWLQKTEYVKAVADNMAENSSVVCPENRRRFFEDAVSMNYSDLENKYLYPSFKLRVKKVLIRYDLWKYVENIRGGNEQI